MAIITIPGNFTKRQLDTSGESGSVGGVVIQGNKNCVARNTHSFFSYAVTITKARLDSLCKLNYFVHIYTHTTFSWLLSNWRYLACAFCSHMSRHQKERGVLCRPTLVQKTYYPFYSSTSYNCTFYFCS